MAFARGVAVTVDRAFAVPVEDAVRMTVEGARGLTIERAVEMPFDAVPNRMFGAAKDVEVERADQDEQPIDDADREQHRVRDGRETQNDIEERHGIVGIAARERFACPDRTYHAHSSSGRKRIAGGPNSPALGDPSRCEHGG